MVDIKIVISVLVGVGVFAICLGVTTIIRGVTVHEPDNRGPYPVHVYIDYETGIHYLSTSAGGLFPRMREDGKTIWRAEVKHE